MQNSFLLLYKIVATIGVYGGGGFVVAPFVGILKILVSG
jgi:hypothetical protein